MNNIKNGNNKNFVDNNNKGEKLVIWIALPPKKEFLQQ